MNKKTASLLIILIGLIFAAILVVLIPKNSVIPQEPEKPIGGGFSTDQQFLITPNASTTLGARIATGDPSATTTPIYMETGNSATSSIIGYAGLADKVDLNLMAVASTSGTSKLQAFVYTSPNKIDWYKADCYSVASTVLVTHSATACINEWTITGAGTQTLNIPLGDVQSKYFKIDFGVVGANASLWAEARPRDVTPN